jgi:hypothetical protein
MKLFSLLFINCIQAKSSFDYQQVSNILPTVPEIVNNFLPLQEGKFRFWQTTDCLSILYENSPFSQYYGCYFQNPNAPYGLMLFPPHEQETIDQYYGFPIQDGNLTGTWHLKKNEVIVLLGMTPPECKYFSFSNYLYSRYLSPDWVPESKHRLINLNCPSGNVSDRCEFFASLDDSLNLDRGLNLDPSQKFNSSFALVLSSSIQGTNQAIKGLIQAGVPESLISNYSFPGLQLNLGIDSQDDTFITVMRTAYYQNTSQADNYFNTIPFRVFRMELIDTEVNLYDRRDLVDKKTNFTDASLANVSLNQMKETLLKVIDQVITNITHGEFYQWYLQITQTVSGVPDNGFECIQEGQVCLADCRDTIYPFSIHLYRTSDICQHLNHTCYGVMDGLLSEQEDDVILVAGVNHAQTNMSSYSSMSIYDATYLWGVDEVGDTLLNNTVWNYLDMSKLDNIHQKSLPYLYVYEIRRNCSQISNCLPVPSKPSSDNKAVIGLQDPIVVAERMYNNPETHVAPYLDDVILPVVIHLKKK